MFFKLKIRRKTKEYIRLFREGFKSQLETIKVVDEKGNDITPLKLKQEKLKN